MEEYINREQAVMQLTGRFTEDTPLEEYVGLVNSRLNNLPKADVVERSKVNKAIEELEKEIKENHLNVIEYADTEWILKDFVYGAIDRLKRNIGEQIL